MIAYSSNPREIGLIIQASAFRASGEKPGAQPSAAAIHSQPLPETWTLLSNTPDRIAPIDMSD